LSFEVGPQRPLLCAEPIGHPSLLYSTLYYDICCHDLAVHVLHSRKRTASRQAVCSAPFACAQSAQQAADYRRNWTGEVCRQSQGNPVNHWSGIGCVNGRVTDVRLRGGASGSLDGFGQLTALEILYLDDNQFHGASHSTAPTPTCGVDVSHLQRAVGCYPGCAGQARCQQLPANLTSASVKQRSPGVTRSFRITSLNSAGYQLLHSCTWLL